MAHNIEIKNGVASYAENGLRERAWHSLGQVFDRPMTVKEALEASHADYRVELADIAFLSPTITKAMEGNGAVPTDALLNSVINGKKATVRTDTYQPLGIVSDSYGVVQNLDAFTFVDTLCTGGLTDHAPVIESAGVLGCGERVFITAKFPDDIILDNKGDDRVEMYIVFTTSHDGTGSVRCVVTPIRVVCNNTLNLALVHNSGSLSLRHSSNVMSRLDLTSKENTEFAMRALNLMSVYRNSLEQRFETLRNIRLTEKEVDNIIASITLPEKDRRLFIKSKGINNPDISSQAKRMFLEIKTSVENGVGQDFGNYSHSGLWLVNGLTTYLQNRASYRSDETKLRSLLMGNAHAKVLQAVHEIDRLL